MLEKWNKLSDAQAKIGSVGSGMQCANVAVVDGSEILGKGKGYLEVALEEAERARQELGEGNEKLHRIVLSTVNEVQSVMHLVRCMISDENFEEVCKVHPFLIFTALFTSFVIQT